jgi:hypothetical protein
MELVLWICDIFIQLFAWCVKGVTWLFGLIFGVSEAKKEAKEQAEPYIINAMYTEQNVGMQTAVSGESVMNTASVNAVPANAAVVTTRPVEESAMSLNEQIAAMKSIMEDVKPISELEKKFYIKCVEGYSAAEQDEVGWLKFNKASLVTGIESLVLGFLCGYLPVFTICQKVGIESVGIPLGFVAIILVALLVFYICTKKSEKNKSNFDKCNDEIIRIQEQAKEILVSASSKCKVLHPIYCYPQALYTIVQYLERGRASEIKDAVNFFENELNGISIQERNEMLLYFRLREVL